MTHTTFVDNAILEDSRLHVLTEDEDHDPTQELPHRIVKAISKRRLILNTLKEAAERGDPHSEALLEDYAAYLEDRRNDRSFPLWE